MLDLARLVYFFSWQWQCNFFSGIVEQIWPVYRAPPPQPPLSKNRRRGPLYDFYWRDGWERVCTQACENHPTRKLWYKWLCFSLRSDAGSRCLECFLLFPRVWPALFSLQAQSLRVPPELPARKQFCFVLLPAICNRSQTSFYLADKSTSLARLEFSWDMNCVLTLFVSTSYHFMPSFGAEIRKGML